MSKLLSNLLPLRKTTVWSAFQTAMGIPQRYGVCSGLCLQYNQARTIFVWADHASESIDAVYVGGTVVTNWTWANGIDSTGHPVTFITFNSPPDQTLDVYALGKGKLNPRNNTRFVNPADVLWDFLANVCQLPNYPYSRFVQFKNACDRLNIVVGGSIEDITLSIQGQVREVAAAVGATFCPDSFTLLQVWPGGPDGPKRETLDFRFDLAADAEQSYITNDYTINFDFLNGKPLQALQLECPASIAQYDRIIATTDSRWVNDPRVAYGIAQRYLEMFARTTYQLDVQGIKTPLLVGDFVAITHPVFPVDGLHMIVGRQRDLSLDVTQALAVVPIGPVPAVVFVQASTAFTPLTFDSLNINTVGGSRVITLLNSDGSPIVNAVVTLDNDLSRNTDAGGKVSFPVASMPPGNHLISVVCQDGREFSQTILVGNA